MVHRILAARRLTPECRASRHWPADTVEGRSQSLGVASRYSSFMASRSSDLPEDVEPEQLWRAPDGQHYKVISVSNGRVSMHRATPAGRVLNVRYQAHESLEKMQTEWKLVRK